MPPPGGRGPERPDQPTNRVGGRGRGDGAERAGAGPGRPAQTLREAHGEPGGGARRERGGDRAGVLAVRRGGGAPLRRQGDAVIRGAILGGGGRFREREPADVSGDRGGARGDRGAGHLRDRPGRGPMGAAEFLHESGSPVRYTPTGRPASAARRGAARAGPRRCATGIARRRRTRWRSSATGVASGSSS